MENIYYEPTTPGSARTQLRSELARHTELLVKTAENRNATRDPGTADDSWLLETSLKLAICALALDAAHAEATHQDVRALDADDPGTPTGAPVPYRSIRALADTERALAQDQWATKSPDLRAALDSLRPSR